MQVLSLFYSMATSSSILLLTKPNTARHAEEPNILPLKSPVLSSSCLMASGWFCLVNANGGKHSEHTKEKECLCPAFFLPFMSQHFFGGWDVKHFPSVAWNAMGSWWLATLSACLWVYPRSGGCMGSKFRGRTVTGNRHILLLA